MRFGDNMKETMDKTDPSDIKITLDNLDDLDKIETNRESIHSERIKNAPKIVQDYYNGTGIKFEKGLFRVLVAKKSNRFIFLVMIICIVIVFLKGNFGNNDHLQVVNGYECELSSFSYDDEVYAMIKVHPTAKVKRQLVKLKSGSGEDMYFPVHIECYGISESGVQMKFPENIDKRIFTEGDFFMTKTEDYDIITVACNVTIGDKTKELSVKVTQRSE